MAADWVDFSTTMQPDAQRATMADTASTVINLISFTFNYCSLSAEYLTAG